jgi:FSR family fosmidomycin resistance protein-like MFS transporter
LANRTEDLSTDMDATTQPAATAAPPAEDDFQLGRVLTITAGHASHDTFTSMLAPLLPLFIQNFSLSKTEAGLLSMFALGPSLLQPFVGHLSDRMDLLPLLVLAPTCTALAYGLLGRAPSYAALAVLLLLAGVSAAVFHGVGPGLTGRLSGRRLLGRGMALFMLGGELGYSLGPLLVVTVVQYVGLRRTPWMTVVGVVGSLLLFVRLRGIPFQAANQDAAPAALWDALRHMRPVLLPVIGLVALRSFALCALGSFLPTYLSETGTGFWLAGASLTVYQGAAAVGVVLGGTLSDRLGRRSILLFSMLSTPALLLLFLRLSGAAQLAMLALIGVIIVTFDPVTMALVQENYTENRALASATFLAMLFIVRSLAVVIMGAVADRLGLRWAFAASAYIFVLGAPLVFLLPARPGARP